MNKRKKIFLTGIVALIIILVLIRGPLLRLYVSGKTKQLEARYSLIVSYEKLKMYGIAGVKIEGFTIYPKGGDTLFSADYVKLKMNPFKLLFLTPDIRRLDVKNMSIRFVKSDSTSNFDFLYKETKKANADSLTAESSGSRLNYAKNTDYLLSLVLGILPAKANIDKLDISYINRGYSLNIHLPSLKVDKDRFETEITATENGISEILNVDGVLDDSDRKISTRIYSRDSAKFSVPFLDYRWGAKVQFDTLAFELAGSKRENDEIHITGKALAKGVSVFHERLSPENVLLDKGRFEYKLNIGKNYIELDSSSVAHINDFAFSPFLRAEKMKKWHITASLNKSDFTSGELFSSLPKGLFYNLDGIKTEGVLNYHFYLDLDLSQVDSLKIESLLKPKKFKILNFGNTDLRKMNGSFEYTAYEKGVPVRSFIVGPENPNFRPLGRISQYLQIAVLQS
ncbi:MAG: glycosyl transferase, partial [Bacteroidales bacterium]|nr:glycosyl transferase [Bacteroidales bacterium]